MIDIIVYSNAQYTRLWCGEQGDADKATRVQELENPRRYRMTEVPLESKTMPHG